MGQLNTVQKLYCKCGEKRTFYLNNGFPKDAKKIVGCFVLLGYYD